MKKPVIPESEKYLLKLLWSTEEKLSVGGVQKKIKDEKTWTLSTIRTLLVRLEEKGYVKKESKYFVPTYTEDQYKVEETENFLKIIHGNSISKLMSALSGRVNLTKEELDELQEWLDEQKGKNQST